MKIRVVVDRIEGELAVLEVEGKGWVEWPVKFLPRGTREGSILDAEFILNREAELRQRAKVSKLQQELLDRTKKSTPGK
ncbi:MAG: DUF3006 domain-containing protein [Candidatus Aureabacteria bacterium]|nr:DUF3006 domain-containing protein [Candidatus Auribacterota bacterium]